MVKSTASILATTKIEDVQVMADIIMKLKA